MKKILFIILLALPALCQAQKHIVKIGTDGYVTIDGQNYKRGDLRSYYTYNAHDSGLAIVFSIDRTKLIPYTIDTNFQYGDSSNANARNMTILRTWFNTNFEYKQ